MSTTTAPSRPRIAVIAVHGALVTATFVHSRLLLQQIRGEHAVPCSAAPAPTDLGDTAILGSN